MLAALKKKLFGKQVSSNERAKSRLHFVLVQDRTGLNGTDMSKFKEELMGVLEKFFVIDKSGFDISYERQQAGTTLLINSPVVVRRQDTPDKQVGSKRKRSRRIRKRSKRKPNPAQAANTA